MKIGFVGLGIMGHAMALNLLRSGFELSLWNRTSGKADKLLEAGAVESPSLIELAHSSEVIITIINDTPDVEEVILGKYGVIAGLEPGKLVIDMSTICPDATEGIAKRLQAVGCEMIDAPVSGGDIGAKNGALTIMAGGGANAFARARPLFEAMGENIVHCGGNGDGQRVKMINQVLCGLHSIALAEAFILAEKMGLNLETTHRVVASGAAGSWALDNYGPRLLKNDLAPGFKLAMQQKDLRIAKNAIDQQSGDLRAAQLAYDLFTEANNAGHSELGAHGIIKYLKEIKN